MILFYIIEKYLSKNEKDELNEKNQILMKLIILIICYLIFNSTHIYLLKLKFNINDIKDYMITIIFLMLIEKICFKNYFIPIKYYHLILLLLYSFISLLIILFNQN